MTNDLMQPRQVHSQEAEHSVIGSAMLDSASIAEVEAMGLRQEMFFQAAHQIIWSLISQMAAEGEAVDLFAVTEYLRTRNLLDSVGGFPYLGELANNTPCASNAAAYAKVVMQYAKEREWLAVGEQIREVFLYRDDIGHQERIGMVQQMVTQMSSEQRSKTQFSIAEGVRLYIDDLQDRYENPGIRGLLTGYRHIDHRLNGLQPGDLWIVAGRPGMGKTTYAMNVALQAAKAGKRVLVFSLEMSVKKLVQRLIAAEGEVQMGLLQSAKVLEHEQSMPRMMAAIGRLKDTPMEIDEQSGLTIAELRARALREHRKAPLDLVVVDYLGLLGSTMKTENVTYKLAEITRGLKVLAGDLGCTVMALAQVNRECEKRTDKRPRTSDLRDSGSLEQDADVIQFVYRDEVYNENTDWKNQVEIITGKLRDGEPGTDYLIWHGQYNKINDNPNPPQSGDSAGGGYGNGFE